MDNGNSTEGAFEPDDYFAVYEEFFAPLTKSSEPFFNPAGFLDTQVHTAEHLPKPNISEAALVPYYSEGANNLDTFKEPIVALLSRWERRTISPESVTLCNSVTTASFVLLDIMRKHGVRRVYFETPCYYATLYQAAILKLPITKLPTYRSDRFRLPLDKIDRREKEPIAVWLTQPRISIGTNQDCSTIDEMLRLLSRDDLLIVDEATELEFPAHLHFLDSASDGPTIVRMRALFKGLGLNGPRLTVILHPPTLHAELALALWLYQGGMDVFSLTLARETAADTENFRLMLDIAKTQATRTRRLVEQVLVGSNVTVLPLVNGYTTSLAVDTSGFAGSYHDRRRSLLGRLRDSRVIATLGSSMFFARDSSVEYLRLNVFLNIEHLVESVNRIKTLACGLEAGRGDACEVTKPVSRLCQGQDRRESNRASGL